MDGALCLGEVGQAIPMGFSSLAKDGILSPGTCFFVCCFVSCLLWELNNPVVCTHVMRLSDLPDLHSIRYYLKLFNVNTLEQSF